MDKSQLEKRIKEVRKIKIELLGPAAFHDLACWLCEKNWAVYNMHPNWCFEPCWDCQEKRLVGKIYRVKSKFIQWLLS